MAALNNPIRTDFALALNAIAGDRKIEPTVVLSAIEEAIVAAYRKDHPDPSEEVILLGQIDPLTGEAKIYEMDGEKKTDITPAGFGRIAAQTAKQVILQKVREAEKSAIISEFTQKIDTIITGMIVRFDGKNVILDIGRGQGFMPPEEQMRGEFYRMNNRLTVYIKEIRETLRGQTIIVSRSAKELVVKLFEREVPEVASQAVEIKAIAREGGIRTKLAVFSTHSGVDPVGSCVGQKGIRVQEVIKELNNEKIDILPYSEDPKVFIASALAPAESLNIEIDEERKSAVVTAPDDQLSLAIGRGGQNVRLAAKLTGYKITIKSLSGQQATVATGEEEYEIDQIGLSKDTRDLLVEKTWTTFEALRDHLEEIKTMGGVSEESIVKIENALSFLPVRKQDVSV
ncbi:MAG: NusA antitermination factor [Microgenomates group bacterium GW2011_GWF2_45_18]|nr:MAG: NusA antitermination factor [Microgenomates group bacterium GW2011_GWF1_44_10]KKU01936.1 MAG: NusA antitermination factor [Microgenomates group bacterium GW2011_GWF2_45_18]OGJ41462.1 MAG: transcription termination factor NusA [Candidatus Pacebacteria bacterium RIFOXYB1_FULL_44_10]HAU98750.1 transcription termination/antitermination protein NusA [Candidatus Paceibacterota bacterium]HAX01430.1 transcription termination/antitermination protein NusA [Candidatus Paceibacterota bacterium]